MTTSTNVVTAAGEPVTGSVDALEAQAATVGEGVREHDAVFQTIRRPFDAPLTTKIDAQDVCVDYGPKRAIHHVSLKIPSKAVTAFIGPSGCGKSTFLRCINRMNYTIENCVVTGEIDMEGENLNDKSRDVVLLRARVGMVFQKPNPFPKSIYDNIAYGPKIHGVAENKTHLDQIVEESLKKAGLWKEVKDRLNEPGTGLSGGQQQRLCIARAIAVSPEVILMDEPCSALDPIATATVEELIHELRENYTIVIVTHSMAQAERVSQKTCYFHLGYLVEEGPTPTIFNDPEEERTKQYISGVFG